MSDDNDTIIWRDIPIDLVNGHAFIGSAAYCSGCGKGMGVFSVIIPENWIAPPEPQWPYKEGECPVCSLRDEVWAFRGKMPDGPPQPTLQERLAKYKMEAMAHSVAIPISAKLPPGYDESGNREHYLFLDEDRDWFTGTYVGLDNDGRPYAKPLYDRFLSVHFSHWATLLPAPPITKATTPATEPA